MQFGRLDRQGDPPDPVDAEFHGGNPAVERRTVVLDAGGHVDDLGLDVLGDLHQQVVAQLPLAPRRQSAADRDVQGRRPGDAGAKRGIGPRPQLEPFRLEEVKQVAEQLQIVVGPQLRPVVHFDPDTGVFGDDRKPIVGPRTYRAVRPQADRDVQRLRAFVKEIERPDVESAAREVDPRWCG